MRGFASRNVAALDDGPAHHANDIGSSVIDAPVAHCNTTLNAEHAARCALGDAPAKAANRTVASPAGKRRNEPLAAPAEP